tara:strand:- start:43934 stop:44476 length:543 start_codon:yes stop_codon:yes gene_type:complete
LSPGNGIQIIGRNGIGKTTLIKILSSILYPSTGEIFWKGKNIHKNLDKFFYDLSVIMDLNTGKKDLTIIENINFWKSLFSSSITEKEIDSILDLLNLQYLKNTKVKYLSFGEKRKLEISRLVIERKTLWIFDEPFLGLDKNSMDIFIETIKNHLKDNGMIIFASHHNIEVPNLNLIDLEN